MGKVKLYKNIARRLYLKHFYNIARAGVRGIRKQESYSAKVGASKKLNVISYILAGLLYPSVYTTISECLAFFPMVKALITYMAEIAQAWVEARPETYF